MFIYKLLKLLPLLSDGVDSLNTDGGLEGVLFIVLSVMGAHRLRFRLLGLNGSNSRDLFRLMVAQAITTVAEYFLKAHKPISTVTSSRS